MKRLLCICFIIVCSMNHVSSQTLMDSIQELDAVVLPDVKLKQFASGYKITVLNDSVIKKNNAASLTDLLRFNSNLYFKENGYGMVASPSFRGTNASQTAVVWNGININSQLNGQTDFNTLTSSPFNAIAIRSGGGSVQYGTGAIGGSIHLTNTLQFQEHSAHRLSLLYGSFNRTSGSYTLSAGNAKWSANAHVSYLSSDNDYKYLGTDQRNENGDFNNLNVNANLGYFLSENNLLKFYHQSVVSDRHLSGTLVAPSRSKYEDVNHRSLLEWAHINKRYTSQLRVAHLFEDFKFFENEATAIFSQGMVRSLIVNHNLDVTFTEGIRLKTQLEYIHLNGEGDNFGKPTRDAFSATVLWSHKLTKFQYGVNFRQDITSDFSSPLVLSADAKYDLFKNYSLKFNGSKNYRIPTFNDLYWQPGGNLNLTPESSYQLDLGQEYMTNAFGVMLNTYYITTKDMIQWRPDISGLWSPENINSVETYGAEFETYGRYTLDNHQFELRGNYSYTVAEDTEAGTQLIYVPFHKANANVSYAYKDISVYYQHVFNGEVSAIGNDLDAFDVGNIGLTYTLSTKNRLDYQLHFKINNLYNTYYENVAFRPMPNRNFQIQINLTL